MSLITNYAPQIQSAPWLLALPFFIFPLVIWSIVWKGIALWKAARLSQKWWFIILLVVNTFGILEIIYIYAVAKKAEKMEGQQKAM